MCLRKPLERMFVKTDQKRKRNKCVWESKNKWANGILRCCFTIISFMADWWHRAFILHRDLFITIWSQKYIFFSYFYCRHNFQFFFLPLPTRTVVFISSSMRVAWNHFHLALGNADKTFSSYWKYVWKTESHKEHVSILLSLSIFCTLIFIMCFSKCLWNCLCVLLCTHDFLW